MTDAIPDITVCPECNTEMTPTELVTHESGVSRTMTLTCDCGYSTPCGQVFYPGRGFEIVTEAADEPCAVCGVRAEYRTQRVNEPGQATCRAHTLSLHADVLEADSR